MRIPHPLNRWREWRVERIEEQVGWLTDSIDKLRRVAVQRGDPGYEAEAEYLAEQRKALWLKRSAIVKKLPPIYEGATNQ